MKAQHTLIAMRLADMHRRHPQQDNSRTCAGCGHAVGIFPSGQAVLKANLVSQILCQVCSADKPFDFTIPAAKNAEEMARESIESYDTKPAKEQN